MAKVNVSISSDNLVRLDKLTNASTGAYVNTATVTFSLKNSSGVLLQGPTTMDYVAASNGRYEGVIQDTLALTEFTDYVLEITATVGSTVLFKKVLANGIYAD